MKIYGFFSKEVFGIVNNWNECKKISENYKAKFKKFNDFDQAIEWLKSFFHDEPAIFFDSGTGCGQGVEIKLANEKFENITSKIIPQDQINARGNYFAPKDYTNNMGELLALFFALKLANKCDVKKIFGDSMLVIKYWSNGIIKKSDSTTQKLVADVMNLKKIFVDNGGEILYIDGKSNPADLGYHKD